MKMIMLAVYDNKAKAYLRPIYVNTKGEGIRVFSDLCNDPTHGFGKHPEDYTLFLIGTWDDNSAKVEMTTPDPIGNGLEFVDVEYQEYLARKSETITATRLKEVN